MAAEPDPVIPYRSGMSPGYRRKTRRNSSSVSPRSSTRIEPSSAPSRKARRSLRLNSVRRAARSVASRVLWSICQFWVLSLTSCLSLAPHVLAAVALKEVTVP